MVWLTENSTVPMVTGTLLVIILLGMAFASREKLMLQLALVIGLMTAVVVICEQVIVTDREEVTECVYELADLVQANSVDGVVGYVSKKRPVTRERVENEMPDYDFDSCRVIGTNYFTPGEDGATKTAEICFVVTYRVRAGKSPELLFGQRRVTLNFEKESDGKWRIVDYSHEDPRRGMGL